MISMENVKKFYDALVSDKGLQERAAALNEKYKDEAPNENESKAQLLSFAKSEGYEFTADEFETYSKQAKPVSDDITDAAAGGAYDDGLCFCAIGGGGKDPVTGNTCACVVVGIGKADNEGNCLQCSLAGWVGL